jgi:hypothetical protein
VVEGHMCDHRPEVLVEELDFGTVTSNGEPVVS